MPCAVVDHLPELAEAGIAQAVPLRDGAVVQRHYVHQYPDAGEHAAGYGQGLHWTPTGTVLGVHFGAAFRAQRCATRKTPCA